MNRAHVDFVSSSEIASPARPPRRKLPPPVWLFVKVCGIATEFCIFIELFCASRGMSITYLSPFFVGAGFYDLMSYQARFHVLHTPAFFSLAQPFPFSYPAPAAILYALFFLAPGDRALHWFLELTLGSWLAVAALFARALCRRRVAVWASVGFTAATALFAFPFWFLFQRANIEIFVFLFLACGLWAFMNGHGYLAACCFGLAASLKLVPVIYLALFLPRRQFRQLGFGLAVAGVTAVLALAFIGPTPMEAWRGLALGLAAFQQEFLHGYNPNAIGFDHALFGLYRRWWPITPSFGAIVSAYTRSTALAGILIYFLRIVRLPVVNQVLCLVTAAVWLPPVSFEYTLIHLYLCLGALVFAALDSTEQEAARLVPYFVLLGLLVAPLGEFISQGVRYGGQIKSVLLGCFFVLSLARPVKTHLDAAVGERESLRVA